MIDGHSVNIHLLKSQASQIFGHYSYQGQANKLAEEMDELLQAIRNGEDRTNIIEEIADVAVMITQFMEHYKIQESEILSAMEYKINRQLNRIDPTRKKDWSK